MNVLDRAFGRKKLTKAQQLQEFFRKNLPVGAVCKLGIHFPTSFVHPVTLDLNEDRCQVCGTKTHVYETIRKRVK